MKQRLIRLSHRWVPRYGSGWVLWVWLAGVAALTGCRTPMGADRASRDKVQRQLAANVLVDRMSDASAIVLHRFGLKQEFSRNPVGVLQTLHERACTDGRRDELYALAELNFRTADRCAHSVRTGEARQAPNYYLAAAIYAWFYLLGDGREPAPSPYDQRFRVACDLYNHGVALGFATDPQAGLTLPLTGDSRSLGPGPVDIQFTPSAFKWKLDEIEAFLPADEFVVRGLTVRDRQSGLGAPLIAVGRVLDQKKFTRRIPATLILRVPGSLSDWGAGGLKVSLELYSSYDTRTVELAGQNIPMEADITAPLAHGLNDSLVWKLGSSQFFSAEERIKSGIYPTQPYEPGRIPVIFIHGTLSSPIWWAEMWNTLRADSVLRERCQFWNFMYNSGNPIGFSAARLQEEINRKIRQLDPEGKDPALRQMVVIGHSQGGLLARLTVTDTGEHLWKAVSEKEFEELRVPADKLELLRRCYFFKPVPSVKRVVFISTPHRGSYQATSLVRKLALHFISLPKNLVTLSASLITLQDPLGLKPGYERRVPTSLDDMAPKNPWLLALADLPTATDVTAHSIIAIKGPQHPPDGADGVVDYRSAHVPYARSELVVHAGHSCQERPDVIEEVRRILYEHIDALATTGTL